MIALALDPETQGAIPGRATTPRRSLAVDKAKTVLWASPAPYPVARLTFTTPLLTVAALYENSTDDEQSRWREDS